MIKKIKLNKLTIIKLFVSLFFLSLANFLYFFNHYINGYGIPWDFMSTYHAVPYYWIEALKNNIDPSWIPYQGIGYPLHLNLQSGYFYPLFKLFYIFKIEYTIKNAIFFQGFHVLIGGIGFFIIARQYSLNWIQSIFVAIAYQGFGGFYGNASHPDIVRYYSLLPWVLSPFIVGWNLNNTLFKFSLYILPIGTYFFITGSYPGGVIATAIVLFLLIFLRILIFRDSIKVFLIISFLMILGCLLSSSYLIPILLNSSEIARTSTGLEIDSMKLVDFLSLWQPVSSKRLPHDITMRSYYVSLPILLLFIFSLLKFNKEKLLLLLTVFIGIIFSFGLIHPFLNSVSPLLTTSRFVVADYKAFICIPIILLAGTSLKNELPDAYGKIIVFLLCILLMTAGFDYFKNESIWGRYGAICIIVWFVITILAIYWKNKFTNLILFILLIFIAINGYIVNFKAGYFALPEGQLYFNKNINAIIKNENSSVSNENSENCRPERKNILGASFTDFSWQGYYNKNYMLYDYSGPMQLSRQQKILKNPVLNKFASKSWISLKFPFDQNSYEPLNSLEKESAFVCMKYTANSLTHLINNPEPAKWVENEIYYPGWTASLFDSENENLIMSLKPTDVDGFRGWNFPAGKFKMVEIYEQPFSNYINLIYYIAIFVLIIHLLIYYKLINFLHYNPRDLKLT